MSERLLLYSHNGNISIFSKDGGLSPGAIAGIAVGTVAGVGGIAAVVVVLVLFVF